MVEFNRNVKQTIGTIPSVVSVERNSFAPRKSIILTNTSIGGQVITLGIDDEAANGEGIVLYAGGNWQDSTESGYKPTQKQITAISSAADGVLSIQERMGD